MSADHRLLSDRFPRSSQYSPDWLIANGMGAHPLWMTEWLTSAMTLRPGMRVLDLGCGRACSSIFLAREFGVKVWATDLWISATENMLRIRDAGFQESVFPIHADARALPFAGEFFDAIVCVDALMYFGTDDLYLNYLANFVAKGGQIGFAAAGINEEMVTPIPDHLRSFWTHDLCCLHSLAWWRQHWGRTGIVDIEVADTMPDGWRAWLEWHEGAHPENTAEIETIRTDAGRWFCYPRIVARRRPDVVLQEICWPDTMRSFPINYQPQPLLRS
jgi:cyclopropane fatty-acyl-phospholipid synthase-like methyltransferase